MYELIIIGGGPVGMTAEGDKMEFHIIDSLQCKASAGAGKYDILIILPCGEPWEIDEVTAKSPSEAIQKTICRFLIFVHMTHDYSVHPSKFRDISCCPSSVSLPTET